MFHALPFLMVLACLLLSAPASAVQDGPKAAYLCRRINAAIAIDGRLDEPAWQKADFTAPFADMVTGEPAWLETKAALLHDGERLYVAFRVREPDVTARLAERDAKIYTENDVEVFIAGPDAYYELEVNALGTVYEVFWIWDDAARNPAFRHPAFNASAHPILRINGIAGHVHPRGWRTGFLDWDLPGLEVAVAVQGTLNDPTDRDQGWTVEIAIPWKSLAPLAGNRPLPPKPGDVWPIDLSRFQHRDAAGRPLSPPAGWTAGVHGHYDSHMPEVFLPMEME